MPLLVVAGTYTPPVAAFTHSTLPFTVEIDCAFTVLFEQMICPVAFTVHAVNVMIPLAVTAVSRQVILVLLLALRVTCIFWRARPFTPVPVKTTGSVSALFK